MIATVYRDARLFCEKSKLCLIDSLRLRRDRRLAIGTLALGRRARITQHVVIARHQRHASIVLLALHTLGGGFEVQDFFDLLDFGAQLCLNVL